MGNDTEPRAGWQEYGELRHLLKAMADVVRLNILHALAEGDEITVTDLSERLFVSQPLVSWNLSVLRRAGLVRTRRQGRLVYCSLDRARYQQTIQRLGEVIGPEHAASVAGPPLAPDGSPAAHGGQLHITGSAGPSIEHTS